MDTELSPATVDAIAEAVAKRIRPEIEKFAVRSLAGAKAVLSRDESALVLNQSPRTLEKWASEGEGPRMTRFCRSIGHTIEALAEHVDRHQSPASTPSTRSKPRAAVKQRGAESKVRAKRQRRQRTSSAI
jgi:hypothetical protein